MVRLAIFIDGGYVDGLCRREFRELRPRVDMQAFSECVRQVVAGATPEPVDIVRSYYYTCPPYQHHPPVDDDRDRTAGYRRFVEALSQIPRFQVREGHLRLDGFREDGRPVFTQKQVDLLLGLDAAQMARSQTVTHIALIAGDGDFVPVLEVLKREGVCDWLVHGPRATYSRDLWLAADERLEIGIALMRAIARDST